MRTITCDRVARELYLDKLESSLAEFVEVMRVQACARDDEIEEFVVAELSELLGVESIDAHRRSS